MRRPSDEYNSGSEDSSRSASTEDEGTTSSMSSSARPSAATATQRNGAATSRVGSNPVEVNSTNNASPPSLDAAVAGSRIMTNNPMDERVEVHDGDNIATPRAMQAPRHRSSGSDDASDGADEDSDGESDSGNRAFHHPPIHTAGDREDTNRGERHVMYNAPHDEAIPVAADDSEEDDRVATPARNERPPATQPAQQAAARQSPPQESQRRAGAMVPDNEDSDEEEEAEEEEEEEEEEEQEVAASAQQPSVLQYKPNLGSQVPSAIEQNTGDAAQQPTLPNREYNPAKYARVNAKLSREIQDLFKHILDYQPFVAELPAKLRPFIPDYIPAVGDLDPFVKVPRPDGHPDGLGLYVVDEPAIPQSNPAVVQLELRATNAHVAGGVAQVVDSFEDAANRPEVIDRWINDVKKVHYKKPLPTVVYQKAMPEIDTLLQAWPQMFEDMLNSDVQFPSSNIDLDLNQYVRTLCAILDIPTHTSLIDSLHVMFTLYEEFRGNQHFQHE